MEHEVVPNDTDVKDYHRYAFKHSSLEQRTRHRIGNIWINALVCLKCNDYIRSKNRHDFKFCKCGACAIDGGSIYQRLLGSEEDYVAITEYFDVLHEEA